jgi:hypothetical protein
MNPQLIDLEQRISALESARNLNAYESVLQLLVKDITNVTDADVTIVSSGSDTVGTEGGTVNIDINVLDFPDRWIEMRLNGVIYRVPAYLKRLDDSR